MCTYSLNKRCLVAVLDPFSLLRLLMISLNQLLIVVEVERRNRTENSQQLQVWHWGCMGSYSFNLKNSIYFKNKERGNETCQFFSHSVKFPQRGVWGSDQRQEPGTSPNSPEGGGDSSTWAIMCAVADIWDEEQSWTWNPGTLTWGVGIPNNALTAVPNVHRKLSKTTQNVED